MTTEAPKQFFSDPDNARLLQTFAKDLRSIPSSAVKPLGLIENLVLGLDIIISNTSKFDEFCETNILWIGDKFINEINGFRRRKEDEKEETLTLIFTSVFRFICELDFAQPGETNFDLRRIMNYVHDNLDKFSGLDRQQLIYAAYTMPAQISKRLISHPSIGDFKKFTNTVDYARKLKSDWDSEINQKEELLEALAENLKNRTSEYNFVGLVNGFKSLRDRKDSERRFSFCWLIVIAGLMVLAPSIQIGFVVHKIEVIESHKLTLAYTLPTIVALEVILLYFFRVLLSHFRSVKAQLLQLDMRIALCQFIESYAEYASRIKSQDASALSKFEALIFSGLVPDESSIPSTFDGAEQIASLINSIRGGGGKS